MEIKVIAPQEMSGGEGKLQEAITKFEQKLRKEDKDEKYYHVVISGEYNRDVLNKVEAIYREAGWSYVKAKTSSEIGERSGLTGLRLNR